MSEEYLVTQFEREYLLAPNKEAFGKHILGSFLGIISPTVRPVPACLGIAYQKN